jgi:plastocyanin
MFNRASLFTVALLLVSGLAAPVMAAPAEATPYAVTIKDHKFQPDTLKVKAGEKIKLTVHNDDATAEEFESHALQREKVVAAHSDIIILLRPLAAGTYPFFGDFHQDTAQGKIIAE